MRSLVQTPKIYTLDVEGCVDIIESTLSDSLEDGYITDNVDWTMTMHTFSIIDDIKDALLGNTHIREWVTKSPTRQYLDNLCIGTDTVERILHDMYYRLREYLDRIVTSPIHYCSHLIALDADNKNLIIVEWDPLYEEEVIAVHHANLARFAPKNFVDVKENQPGDIFIFPFDDDY